MVTVGGGRKRTKSSSLRVFLLLALVFVFWRSTFDINGSRLALAEVQDDISYVTDAILSTTTSAAEELSASWSLSEETTDTQQFVPIIWKGEQALPIDSIFKQNSTIAQEELFDGSNWLLKYVKWHNTMRNRFPDEQLFENPKAPKVVIVFNCGKQGLNDRVTHLHQMAYAAHKRKKVLLLRWFGAASNLETYVLPNLINWTVPHIRHTTFEPCQTQKWKAGYLPTPEMVAAENQSAKPKESQKIKVHSTDHYRTRNKKVNANIKDCMHIIWHVFFKPSPLLQDALNKESSNLGLIPGKYNAAHCRVRHPAHFKTSRTTKEDLDGAKYEGKQRQLAIRTAMRALQCTQYASSGSNADALPIYFYSDAEQLVHSVIRHDPPKDELEKTLHLISNRTNAVGRYSEVMTRHIGDGKDGEIESYLSTFVDLYIAASAKCIGMGVGNFAYLASRISNTDCTITHEIIPKALAESWGMKKYFEQAHNCPMNVSSYE
eukprot:scaffold1529_cov86-Cylindrotheca_fusiformis.AAC.1